MTNCPIYPNCQRDPDFVCRGPDKCAYQTAQTPPWWLAAALIAYGGLLLWVAWQLWGPA